MATNVKCLSDEEIGQLDKGIRKTVQWLRSHGFETTDSGDGTKVATMECALNYPNVTIRLESPDDLMWEADRLKHCLEAEGIEVEPQSMDNSPFIQATYDPADGSSTILLAYVDDLYLFGPEQGST